MSHTDMGIVGATTDTFILFENGVRRNRLVLPGLSNAADHMPSKPDPPTAPLTEQPDHSAGSGDSITSSTRIRFSVHRYLKRTISRRE
jgi:hypothetical protein